MTSKPEPGEGMPLKLLLVDDNATFLAAVRHFLNMLPGLEVVGESHDGAQALMRSDELKPDVLLLDIAMPGMSGLEVARIVLARADPPQVVFLSMQDNDAYRQAAHQMGAAFVGKSNFVAELLPMLELMIVARNIQAVEDQA